MSEGPGPRVTVPLSGEGPCTYAFTIAMNNLQQTPSESLRCHTFPPHSSASSAHQNQLLCQHATPGLCLWVPENKKPKVPRQELYNRVKRHSCCTPGRSAALEEEASDPSKPQCGGRPATPFHPASHLALSSVTSEPVQRMFRDYTGV